MQSRLGETFGPTTFTLPENRFSRIIKTSGFVFQTTSKSSVGNNQLAPLDGGWGWMVVFSSFVIYVIVFGSLRSVCLFSKSVGTLEWCAAGVCSHAALPGQMRITRWFTGHKCMCQALRVRQLVGYPQKLALSFKNRNACFKIWTFPRATKHQLGGHGLHTPGVQFYQILSR